MFGIEAKKILVVALVLLTGMALRDWSMREIVHPPGILVPERPSQNGLENATEIHIDSYRLKPRANFQIRARVLSREDYSWGTEADLSPVDLALGWGVMSDQAVLDRISINQSGRWYYTRYELPAPIPDQAIIQNSGNMHMIPSNDWVRKKLKKIRRGDIVQLRGQLVDIDGDSGWFWRTSMTRNDTGGGSCEILYLQDVMVEERS